MILNVLRGDHLGHNATLQTFPLGCLNHKLQHFVLLVSSGEFLLLAWLALILFRHVLKQQQNITNHIYCCML